jgi:hypothetical protein
MLDFDYPKHYAELINKVTWSIELPTQWTDYFGQSGLVDDKFPEKRGTQRRIVRLRGLLCVERALPAIPRDSHLIGVYTKDFSKDSCGMLIPIQLYPEEQVRLILPTFWLSLKVVRNKRETATCYDTGLQLLGRHDPDRSAFILGGNFLQV